MTFENNFINHSKEYIFLDNETLLNQREETFKKNFFKKIMIKKIMKVLKIFRLQIK
jgi:hypothetical protein